jgi:hypothetical protein
MKRIGIVSLLFFICINYSYSQNAGDVFVASDNIGVIFQENNIASLLIDGYTIKLEYNTASQTMNVQQITYNYQYFSEISLTKEIWGILIDIFIREGDTLAYTYHTNARTTSSGRHDMLTILPNARYYTPSNKFAPLVFWSRGY